MPAWAKFSTPIMLKISVRPLASRNSSMPTTENSVSGKTSLVDSPWAPWHRKHEPPAIFFARASSACAQTADTTVRPRTAVAMSRQVTFNACFIA